MHTAPQPSRYHSVSSKHAFLPLPSTRTVTAVLLGTQNRARVARVGMEFCSGTNGITSRL